MVPQAPVHWWVPASSVLRDVQGDVQARGEQRQACWPGPLRSRGDWRGARSKVPVVQHLSCGVVSGSSCYTRPQDSVPSMTPLSWPSP